MAKPAARKPGSTQRRGIRSDGGTRVCHGARGTLVHACVRGKTELCLLTHPPTYLPPCQGGNLKCGTRLPTRPFPVLIFCGFITRCYLIGTLHGFTSAFFVAVPTPFCVCPHSMHDLSRSYVSTCYPVFSPGAELTGDRASVCGGQGGSPEPATGPGSRGRPEGMC